MEYNGKVDCWVFPDAAYIDCKEIEELVEKYLQDTELEEEPAEEITIYGYASKDIEKDKDSLVEWLLDNLIAHMDEKYIVENGNKEIADNPAVRFSAIRLVKTIINSGYRVEACIKVCEKKIKISDYIEEGKQWGMI